MTGLIDSRRSLRCRDCMYALSHNGLPSQHLETVWQWFCEMPAFIKKQMRRSGQDKAAFQKGFENDLVYLVFDDGLLGAVIAEPQPDGTHEIHLFCPRRTPSNKLAEAIHTFFEQIEADKKMKRLMFKVRSSQKRLGYCLEVEGCRHTGWRYREMGETFVVMFKDIC